MYDGDGDLACVVCGAALDSRCDYLAGSLVSLVLVLLLDLLYLHGHLVSYILTDAVDEVSLGILNGEAGDLLEHFELTALDLSDFLLLCFCGGYLSGELFALLFDSVCFSVEVFFLLLKAAFLLLNLGAARLFFPLEFGAVFVYFFLCLYESFSFLALGVLYSFIYYSLCFFLCARYLALTDLFAVLDTEEKTYCRCNNGYNNSKVNRHSK